MLTCDLFKAILLRSFIGSKHKCSNSYQFVTTLDKDFIETSLDVIIARSRILLILILQKQTLDKGFAGTSQVVEVSTVLDQDIFNTALLRAPTLRNIGTRILYRFVQKLYIEQGFHWK